MSAVKRIALGFVLIVAACDDGDDGDSGDSMGSATGSTTTTTTTTTTSTTTTTTTSTSAGSSSGGDGDGDEVDPMVLAMCQCLLINCHDPYHEQYGETDFEAAIACNEDGSSLPLTGEGESVECRLNACSMSECEAGLGLAAPCMQ